MSKEREIFIKQYTADVIAASKGTGLFPSVVMAQMMIESADRKGKPGQGITALKAKNFFGIKASKAWTGPTMAFNTPKDGKPVNLFRVYNTPQDSIRDRNKFLKENPRYTKGGVFSAKNPEEQAWALQNSRYAEGRDGKGGGYADTIIGVIKMYNLKQLDVLAGLAKNKAPEPTKGDNDVIYALGSLAALFLLSRL